MLSQQLERSLHLAKSLAEEKCHEYLTIEHLLLALLEDEEAVGTLIACDVKIELAQEALVIYIDKHNPIIDTSKYMVTPTQGFDRILQRAIFHVQSTGDGRLVDGSDILVAMLSEHDSFAVYLLKKQGLSRLKLTQYLSHGDDEDEGSYEDEEDNKHSKNALIEFTTDLNKKAQQGNTDPLIGRNYEIERTAQILCRRRKNNPMLVGDPGVGKTAVAEGLAWLIVNKRAPKPLQNAIIYSLDVGSLIAGTKYRGDFEKRMKALLKALKDKPEAILFVDEIHMIIGAGSSMNSNMDVSNLIKPALSNGDLRCIGSTTFTEYRQVFEKDHALSRRFQKLDINEPSIADSIKILHGLKSTYEEFHSVTYSDKALETAVELSSKHIHERFLPDKAIDVIDEAGAYQRLKIAEHADDTKKNNGNQIADLIDVSEIEAMIAKLARIPPNSVSKDDKNTLKDLDMNLKRLVFGQDEAIDTLADAIKLSRAGLKAPDQPIGSFMFAGPTGVGKTEVSKQLAKLLGIELIRFDMSEYMESHTASRLIGAPPGYVGFDQGGLLTEKINQHPHCVLLLDEVEKAHKDVFNLLLQVMDNGSLTDNNGRVANFKQVILIMTTNVGADSISRSSMGFTKQDHSKDNTEVMKRAFTPEFRNRLDATIQFNPLDSSIILSVVDKFLAELQAQLDDKKVTIEITDSVREYLADKGYDKLMGARPMQRLIQSEIKKPLASMILFGDLVHGGVVNISLEGDDDKSENNKSLLLNVIESYKEDQHSDKT